MKKAFFFLIAVCTLSTTIYASFPVVKENTNSVENSQPLEAPAAPYDKETMVVLCAIGFIGVAGLHRLVAGDTLGGILMLLTAGMCGIWTLIDLIRLASGNWTPGR